MSTSDRTGGWVDGVGEGLPVPPHINQFIWDFVQGMAERLYLGWLKYEKQPVVWDHRATAWKVLAKYEEDGNREHLIDLANYALLEFAKPSHPNAHLRETDSDEAVLPIGQHVEFGYVAEGVGEEFRYYRYACDNDECQRNGVCKECNCGR